MLFPQYIYTILFPQYSSLFSKHEIVRTRHSQAKTVLIASYFFVSNLKKKNHNTQTKFFIFSSRKKVTNISEHKKALPPGNHLQATYISPDNFTVSSSLVISGSNERHFNTYSGMVITSMPHTSECRLQNCLPHVLYIFYGLGSKLLYDP